MDYKKIKEYLIKHEDAQKVYEQDYFRLAICEIILENYPKAKDYLSQSMTMLLGPNPFWRKSGQPNWLVDIAILSGRSELYPLILEELTIYRVIPSKSGPVGTSPIAYYCYCIMEMLNSNSGNISEWIKDLKKRTKYKDLFAAGFVLQAILDRNQEEFTKYLQLLLQAHAGMARYGDLRLIPEGWLCLPAMTLSFLAYQKKLTVEIENEYLSVGYLEYLLSNQMHT